MKRILILLIVLSNMQIAQAADSASIKLSISGALSHNRYFLCLPGVGCLSIKAGQSGKTFPVLHAFEMDNMYLMDAGQGAKLHFQGLPSSCNKTVNVNQTVTISGSIGNNGSSIVGLRCKIS